LSEIVQGFNEINQWRTPEQTNPKFFFNFGQERRLSLKPGAMAFYSQWNAVMFHLLKAIFFLPSYYWMIQQKVGGMGRICFPAMVMLPQSQWRAMTETFRIGIMPGASPYFGLRLYYFFIRSLHEVNAATTAILLSVHFFLPVAGTIVYFISHIVTMLSCLPIFQQANR
jgi:hypothetical protein